MRRTPFANICLLVAFLFNSVITVPVSAQELVLPKPGVMLRLSPPVNPAMLKGMKVDTRDPFKFEFVLDQGDERSTDLKVESTRLIKYFLASLTIPERDLWVNLSPYEKDRVIPDSFGTTEMGRDLLAQDYILKQVTASLIYPEDEIGRRFWKRVYEKAAERYKTTNIPVNTFNKVWIVPEKAVVYENAKSGTAYVVESRLKVMLESDYLSLSKNAPTGGHVQEGTTRNVSPSTLPSDQGMKVKAPQGNPLTKHQLNELGSEIVREIVIPELTREVNEGKNFAQLRQVYNSLILATWYKKKIRDSILSKVYADKNKIASLNPDVGSLNSEAIYKNYLEAFKKGVYNYIKEDIDPVTQERTPRKYFSGGVKWDMSMMTTTSQLTGPMPAAAMKVDVKLALSQDPAVDLSTPKERSSASDELLEMLYNVYNFSKTRLFRQSLVFPYYGSFKMLPGGGVMLGYGLDIRSGVRTVAEGEILKMRPDTLAPIRFSADVSTFIIIHDAQTKETYAAHSRGRYLSELRTLIQEAKEHFGVNNRDVQVFIGGMNVHRSAGRDLSPEALRNWMQDALDVLGQVKESGFELTTAFSERVDVNTDFVFDPLRGGINIKMVKVANDRVYDSAASFIEYKMRTKQSLIEEMIDFMEAMVAYMDDPSAGKDVVTNPILLKGKVEQMVEYMEDWSVAKTIVSHPLFLRALKGILQGLYHDPNDPDKPSRLVRNEISEVDWLLLRRIFTDRNLSEILIDRLLRESTGRATGVESVFDSDQSRNYLKDHFPGIYDALLSPSKAVDLITLLSLMRKANRYALPRDSDLSLTPLEYALKTERYFSLGSGVYVAPVSESFRRHILFKKNTQGEVEHAIELMIPGEVRGKRVLTQNRLTVSTDLADKADEAAHVMMYASYDLAGPVFLYSRDVDFSKEKGKLGVFVYAYKPENQGRRLLDGSYNPSISSEYLKRIEKEKGRKIMPKDIIDGVVSISQGFVDRGYVFRFESLQGGDLHLGNFRLTTAGNIQFVGDFGEFNKSDDVLKPRLLTDIPEGAELRQQLIEFINRVFLIGEPETESLFEEAVSAHVKDRAMTAVGVSEIIDKLNAITRFNAQDLLKDDQGNKIRYMPQMAFALKKGKGVFKLLEDDSDDLVDEILNGHVLDVRTGDDLFMEAGDIRPVQLNCGPCSFIIIYNVKTKETFVAHSSGNNTGELREAIKKAQERFGKGNKDVVLITGGRGINAMIENEASVYSFFDWMKQVNDVLSDAGASGFKVATAFSEFMNVETWPIFDPQNGVLVLKQAKSFEDAVLVPIRTFVKNKWSASDAAMTADQPSATQIEEAIRAKFEGLRYTSLSDHNKALKAILMNLFNKEEFVKRLGLSYTRLFAGKTLDMGIESSGAEMTFSEFILRQNHVTLLRQLGFDAVGISPLVKEGDPDYYYHGKAQDMRMFKDGQFDTVLSHNVFQELYWKNITGQNDEDYQKAAAEIYRVLKPGGIFFLTVPLGGPSLTFLKILKDVGFNLNPIETITRPGRVPESYICIKPDAAMTADSQGRRPPIELQFKQYRGGSLTTDLMTTVKRWGYIKENYFGPWDNEYMVAMADGKPVGIYAVAPRGETNPETAFEGRGISVDPSYQGQGIATRLVLEQVIRLKQKNAESLVIWAIDKQYDEFFKSSQALARRITQLFQVPRWDIKYADGPLVIRYYTINISKFSLAQLEAMRDELQKADAAMSSGLSDDAPKGNEAGISTGLKRRTIRIKNTEHVLLTETKKEETWFNLYAEQKLIAYVYFRRGGAKDLAVFGGIWVDPKYQHQGYAKELLGVYFDHLAERKMDAVEDALTTKDPLSLDLYFAVKKDRIDASSALKAGLIMEGVNAPDDENYFSYKRSQRHRGITDQAMTSAVLDQQKLEDLASHKTRVRHDAAVRIISVNKPFAPQAQALINNVIDPAGIKSADYEFRQETNPWSGQEFNYNTARRLARQATFFALSSRLYGYPKRTVDPELRRFWQENNQRLGEEARAWLRYNDLAIDHHDVIGGTDAEIAFLNKHRLGHTAQDLQRELGAGGFAFLQNIRLFYLYWANQYTSRLQTRYDEQDMLNGWIRDSLEVIVPVELMDKETKRVLALDHAMSSLVPEWIDTARFEVERENKVVKLFNDQGDARYLKRASIKEIIGYKVARLVGVNIPRIDIVGREVIDRIKGLEFDAPEALMIQDIGQMTDDQFTDGSGKEELLVFLFLALSRDHDFVRHNVRWVKKVDKHKIVAFDFEHAMSSRTGFFLSAITEDLNRMTISDIDPIHLDALISKIETMDLRELFAGEFDEAWIQRLNSNQWLLRHRINALIRLRVSDPSLGHPSDRSPKTIARLEDFLKRSEAQLIYKDRLRSRFLRFSTVVIGSPYFPLMRSFKNKALAFFQKKQEGLLAESLVAVRTNLTTEDKAMRSENDEEGQLVSVLSDPSSSLWVHSQTKGRMSYSYKDAKGLIHVIEVSSLIKQYLARASKPVYPYFSHSIFDQSGDLVALIKRDAIAADHFLVYAKGAQPLYTIRKAVQTDHIEGTGIIDAKELADQLNFLQNEGGYVLNILNLDVLDADTRALVRMNSAVLLGEWIRKRRALGGLSSSMVHKMISDPNLETIEKIPQTERIQVKRRALVHDAVFKRGLHGRPAAAVVKIVSSLPKGLNVSIEYKGIEVDADSIIDLMGLGVPQDQWVTVIVNGSGNDAKQAALDVANALGSESRFYVGFDKVSDEAMSSDVGGIDLGVADVAVKAGQEGAIEFKLDPEQLRSLQEAKGFYPIVVSMTPITDLKSFLGAVNPV